MMDNGEEHSQDRQEVTAQTAVKGKRYRCAKCRKRSPQPVKTPAPWYCPSCLKEKDPAVISESEAV
jgi:hypothetical protein